jgi:Putative phage serine protease XkdF
MAQEQRFVLGLAYQAGRDRRIRRGADGRKDFFTPDELEKACWRFMRDRRQQSGINHLDDTLGHIDPVENYIYRNPLPWDVGNGLLIKAGDWVVGGILDEPAWQMRKSGLLTGWSPEGTGLVVYPGSES